MAESEDDFMLGASHPSFSTDSTGRISQFWQHLPLDLFNSEDFGHVRQGR